MFYELSGFWIVIAILFWILIALLTVAFIADVYVRLMYYKWDKDIMQGNKIKEGIAEGLKEVIDNVNKESGAGI